jgi:hypothetical protein
VVQGADRISGIDNISGGAISIHSLCEETSKLGDLHHAETIMVTMNGENLLLRHQRFESNRTVFRFSQLPQFFKSLDSIIIHLPEYMTEKFIETLTSSQKSWLMNIPNRQLNIMNQNIRLMPQPEAIARLKTLAQKVTITTAHQQYCNSYYRQYYGVPIHKLSVWISPEQYTFVKWEEKENLLVVSPDQHPAKREILEKLSQITGLTVQIISGLKYSEYKELISRAKWSLTFGEGLDGYFIEPVFSGAISFSVYNEEFFTSDFKGLRTVYGSMEVLANAIIRDIKELDRSPVYQECQQELFKTCAKYYSFETYKNNLKLYYRGEYSYA